MPDVSINPVESRSERKRFLHLPWQLYRNDPHWVPPLRANQQELAGYKAHPFYDDAEIQTFLALRDGRPCGRVAAIVNHAHNRRHKERRGFFGFFESIDDQAVASGLFNAVREWLAERDIHDIRGPMNPSMNYECGLLTDGFDSPPTFMMTYNPPYYPRLIEQSGFEKPQDMFAFWGHIEMVDTLDPKLRFIADEAERRFDVKMRNLDTKRFGEEVRLFLDIYNQSLVGTWGFTPLSDREIEHMGVQLRWLIVPELTAVAEVEGRPVGAIFALLDYNPLIKQIDGRLFPLGFMKLLWGRGRLKRARLISTNVVPEFQMWGIGLLLLRHLFPCAELYGLTEAEFSWVLESNHLSRASLERGGAKLVKTYRIYDSKKNVAQVTAK